MNEELEKIKQNQKFKINKWLEQNENRVFIDVDDKQIIKCADFIFNEMNARFAIATAIETPDSFEIIYHFELKKSKVIFNVRTFIDKTEPKIDSITPLVPVANFIEREMNEMFGIDFKGHPEMKRLLLPHDWEEGVHPLKRS